MQWFHLFALHHFIKWIVLWPYKFMHQRLHMIEAASERQEQILELHYPLQQVPFGQWFSRWCIHNLDHKCMAFSFSAVKDIGFIVCAFACQQNGFNAWQWHEHYSTGNGVLCMLWVDEDAHYSGIFHMANYAINARRMRMWPERHVWPNGRMHVSASSVR